MDRWCWYVRCVLSVMVVVLLMFYLFFFFFKQKTAYEIYQCDWSSDVCSSDLPAPVRGFNLVCLFAISIPLGRVCCSVGESSQLPYLLRLASWQKGRGHAP